MKVKIRLDTLREVQTFVNIASGISSPVHITDNKGLKVSAKSILGAMYAMEFDELWCESEEDIYRSIENFIVIE